MTAQANAAATPRAQLEALAATPGVTRSEVAPQDLRTVGGRASSGVAAARLEAMLFGVALGDGPARALPVVTKAGAFGTEATLARCVGVSRALPCAGKGTAWTTTPAR